MTQIITGTGLGLHGSSIGLGNYGPKGTSALGQGGESSYINVSNGNLILRQSDGFLADLGQGLDLVQTYNSQGVRGSEWTFNFQSRLTVAGAPNQKGSIVTRISEDGHRCIFHYDASLGCYIPDEGGVESLRFDGSNWIYKKGNEPPSWEYSEGGQLLKIADTDGHAFIFSYLNDELKSITDSSGKQQITWVFEHQTLSDVRVTSEGAVIHHLHYDYDAEGRLSKVTRDLGQGKSYWITYDYAGDSNRITAIRQSDGVNAFIEYDAQGRVKKWTNAEGHITRYEYEAGATKVSNHLNESWTYFYDAQGHLTGVDGPQLYRIRYTYDDGVNLSGIVQGTQRWGFRYNAFGDCIEIEEPNGQRIARRFDEAHHLLLETHYQSFDGSRHPISPKTSRYLYDAHGHLRFMIAADGAVTEHRYDGQGQLISSRVYLRDVFSLNDLDFDALVDIAQLEDWAQAQVAFAVSLTDYRYDWRGQLEEECHYAQVDETGHGTQAQRVRYRYDACGRLLEKSTPMNGQWSTTQYLYDDLGRLIQSIDNQKHITRIEYDDAHQRVIQSDPQGLQTLRIYDKSGLLLSVHQFDAKKDYGQTLYQYDKAGRLSSETGTDGLTQYYFYDPQGRLQGKVSPSGILTEYVYNAQSAVIQSCQYATPLSIEGWRAEKPDWTSLSIQRCTKDQRTQSIYNQYNELCYSVNAEGAVIAYEYDANGQVKRTTAYARRLSEYKPELILSDAEVSLMLISSAKDRSITYYYDARGQLNAEVNAEGYATEYHYNHLGLLIETCRYKTEAVKPLTGDWLVDKPKASLRYDIHLYTLYDASGLKVASVDALGYVTEYRYDERGLLIEQTAYARACSNLVFTPTTTLNDLRPSTDRKDAHTTYTYNDLGLLIEEKTSGRCVSYVYDEMGHVLIKSVSDGRSTRAQRTGYDALGRITQSLDEWGVALLEKAGTDEAAINQVWALHSTRYEYNESGFLSSKTNALGQKTRFIYDAQGQLRYSINHEGAVVETRYNAQNQLEWSTAYSRHLKDSAAFETLDQVAKALQSITQEQTDETTRYEYNVLGQLIAKHTGHNGLIQSEYNAFGELALSKQRISDSRERISVLSYDRRGLLVQTIDDSSGLAKESSIEYDAFGRVIATTDPRHNTFRYALDKRGQQIQLTNAKNQTKQIDYDAFGRVLLETDYTGMNYIKAFEYDDANHRLTLTTGKAKVITEFNAFGDKVCVTDPNGFISTFHYDAQGHLKEVDSPEDSKTFYEYDALGRLRLEYDAAGQVIHYAYDASNHLLSKTIDPHGLNLKTSYQYDAIGRQIQIIEANGCMKQYAYDEEGRLIESCVDKGGLNLATRFAYDDRGLLLRQTECNPKGQDKISAFEWDNLGRRITTIIDPDGLKHATHYEYDANDNLIAVVDANGHRTVYVYDEQNQCRYEVNPNGVVTERIYNKNAALTQTIIYARVRLKV